MHRRILVTLGLFLIASATAQDVPTPTPAPAQPPSKEEFPPIPTNWPALEYAEVRAYLYNPGEKPGNLILQKDKLHPEVTNPEGIKLDAAQIQRLLATFRGKAANGMGVGCFEPHHGFVFYDRAGKPVADVTVCFLCIQGVARPGAAGRMTTWDWDPLKRLIEDLGLPVFKTHEESEAHFIELARHQWSDAKIKAALDAYLFKDEAKGFSMDDFADLTLLQGLGKRTHPYLLAYLADKDGKTDLREKDAAGILPRTRFRRLCDLFGDTPPAAAIPLLAPYLTGADTSARCDAAETIAKTGAPEIVPFVREAFADTGKDLRFSALAGLQVAIDRGALHADAKAQLFPDVRDLGGNDDEEWAKALIGLDSNKAVEFFLRPEIFKPDSPRLDSILKVLCEMNLQLPRERIIGLAAEVGTAKLDHDQWRILEPALLLLGRQRNADDLELLRGQGNETLARFAMPGLLAWHGLEGYRDRLSNLKREKGFVALNEPQRLHFAANEFESSSMGLCFFFHEAKGDQWRDALTGLKAMKRDELVQILEESVAKFGAKGPSNDDEVRYAQLDAFREKHTLDKLDERLEKARDPWDLSLDRFAIEHAESFK